MYKTINISMANIKQHIRYVDENIFGADFSLKGFEYPWIVTAREWKKGEKVLDVGAGYSPLPMYLADTFGCEVWAADDFGIDSEEPFWKRHKEPDDHINKYPQVHFVKERLGDMSQSSLPAGEFDCVFSASALEHVPNPELINVWRHMDALLKPGGELIHGIDLLFPVNRGFMSVLKATLLDLFQPLLPAKYKIKFVHFTPKNYVRLLAPVIGRQDLSRLGTLPMLINPEIVTETPNYFLNRYRENREQEVIIHRITSLLIHVKKAG